MQAAISLVQHFVPHLIQLLICGKYQILGEYLIFMSHKKPGLKIKCCIIGFEIPAYTVLDKNYIANHALRVLHQVLSHTQ